ncbi:M24 family metallopeptidase [Pseudidiomarina sp. E22-M8]|uniref:M24 family metallopeptidase n=1 Tax=Pseudidiomarina sp. E22-M8 TaxID=3424768 RepID=UPI00403C9B4B
MFVAQTGQSWLLSKHKLSLVGHCVANQTTMEITMHAIIKTLLTITLIGVSSPHLSAGEFSQGRVINSADEFSVLSHKARIAPENAMLNQRIKNLLPKLMAETDLDMWLVINREYAEDPVYYTLVPQPTFAARRTTMLVFYRTANGDVEQLSVNRYPLGEPYDSVWSGGNLDDQWRALAELIAQKDPARIGINVSRDWPVADGLTHGLQQRLHEVLPTRFKQRLVSAEQLVVRWVETRSAQEIEVYPQVVGLARGVIAEAFSNRVITPGVTTTEDVAWFIRDRFAELQLPIWFMPYVTLQRAGNGCADDQPFCGQTGQTIQRGDVIHTDVGICYLKLCTDTQEMAYVLPFGASQVPAELQNALAHGNQWQDHLTAAFKTGRTGNELLAATIAKSAAASLMSSTYTHPLGFYGHAPGPTIGMWDNQGPTPIRGNWPVYANTAYAIEGNVKVPLKMWDGKNVQIMLEQSAFFDGEQVIYLAGRQTKWHVIR